ncbi:hypothetical protein GCM10009416_11510 [Craurococcus roseus]|uniref:Uncharacterized protein n=1 Tax=Craurococcus roseus TaxID=77585 RepID=A0ABN1EU73_9PROT
MRLAAAFVVLASLAACSDGPRKLAEPSGPVFRLNPESWAEAERSALPPVASAR